MRAKFATMLIVTSIPCQAFGAPPAQALLAEAQALLEQARFDDAQNRVDSSALYLGAADKELLIRGYRIAVLVSHAKRDRAAMHATISRLIALGQVPAAGEYPQSVLREWQLRAFVVAPIKFSVSRTRIANKWQVTVSKTGGGDEHMPVAIVVWVNQGQGWQRINAQSIRVQATRTVLVYAEAIHEATGVILMRHGSSADPMVLSPNQT